MMLLGAVAGTALLSGAALADDDTGGFYVTPMVQWWRLDGHRDAKSDLGYAGALGYNFAPEWSAELSVSGGTYRATPYDRLHLTEYSVDFIRKFFPTSIVEPYLLAGGGGFDESISGVGHTSTFAGEVGAGLLTDLMGQTGSTRLRLRTEFKYRREFIDTALLGANDPNDLVFGIGLQFEFGIPKPPPPPVVVAPPPPPPLPEHPEGRQGGRVRLHDQR
jgi:OOP family OmpA-OmpF porin